MLDDVITQVIQDMKNDIDEIIEKYQGADKKNRKMKGAIGELVIGRAIKYTLFDMGFNYHPNNFWIESQFGANENNQGGMDFKVTITSENYEFVLLVEAKNWDDYKTKISRDTFRDEILLRFLRVDRHHRCNWLTTMNMNNINDIQDYCDRYGMHIIPLDILLDEDTDYYEILDPLIRSFVTEFSNYVKSIIPAEVLDDIEYSKETDGLTITECLKRGIPDRIIMRKFDVNQQNLDVLKSKMRRKGEKIVYKRSREGKQIERL
jgi:hypothetical protein